MTWVLLGGIGVVVALAGCFIWLILVDHRRRMAPR